MVAKADNVIDRSTRERPILFSGSMVRALLAGTKTQTRRMVSETLRMGYAHREIVFADRVGFTTNTGIQFVWDCPYGLVGDRLWVRESLQIGRVDPKGDGGRSLVKYAADGAEHPHHVWAWQRNTLPSIHMPRGLSRIDLEVTAVRVERAQSITEHDARAEGIKRSATRNDGTPANAEEWWCAGVDGLVIPRPSAREAFADLWSAINGAESWDANPWVWVVEFRKLEGDR